MVSKTRAQIVPATARFAYRKGAQAAGVLVGVVKSTPRKVTERLQMLANIAGKPLTALPGVSSKRKTRR